MSTRAHIELHDAWYKNQVMRGVDTPGLDKTQVQSRLGLRLYHHSDGYPSFMRKKLKTFLTRTYEFLKEAGYPYWWDSERVGATLILLSAEDYYEPLIPFSTDRDTRYVSGSDKPYRPDGGVPVFQPCHEEHSDVEYVWKVVLGPEQGKFKISHKHVIWSDEKKKLVTYTQAERKKLYARLGMKE